MVNSTTGGLRIRHLRTERGMTQKALAECLHVSDRTVSKWERGIGVPDITLLSTLASLFQVRVEYLLGEDAAVNRTDSGDLRKLRFYVCPTCRNLLTATGTAALSCCGEMLRPLEPQAPDDMHKIRIEPIEEDDYITFEHPMEKGHYLMLFAQLDSGRLLLTRTYPEQGAEVRLPHLRRGRIYYLCSRDGLFMCEPWRKK